MNNSEKFSTLKGIIGIFFICLILYGFLRGIFASFSEMGLFAGLISIFIFIFWIRQIFKKQDKE